MDCVHSVLNINVMYVLWPWDSDAVNTQPAPRCGFACAQTHFFAARYASSLLLQCHPTGTLVICESRRSAGVAAGCNRMQVQNRQQTCSLGLIVVCVGSWGPSVLRTLTTIVHLHWRPPEHQDTDLDSVCIHVVLRGRLCSGESNRSIKPTTDSIVV